MTLPRPSSETLTRLDRVLKAPEGKRVGVLGLGIAGKAMALHLARRGARVVAADEKDVAADDLRALGAELRLGPIGAATFDGVEMLAISPGADPRQAAVTAALQRGTPVCGELEIAGQLPARVVGITGTNGKSTTTGLLGALARASRKRTFVGGNFGEPVLTWLDRKEPTDVAVVEISSFQLEGAYRFRCDAAIELNVTPDHLDRYPSVEAYAAAKQRLLEMQTERDIAVLCHDDAYVRAMAAKTRAKVWWFSTRGKIDGDGAWLDGDTLVPQGMAADLGRIDLNHPRLFGRHNRENALAALLAAHAMALGTRDQLLAGYREFAGLEHRLELVADVGGVRYINDSKATNDDAAAIAVQALQGSIVLMLGGRSKHGGYAGLAKALSGKVRIIVAYGEAKDEIAAAFASHPGLVVKRTIKEAFDLAATSAKQGEVVLLSPACSSYDEFKNYVERGRTFKSWVRALEGEP